MLRDDSGNGGGRPSAPRNVLGERLDERLLLSVGSISHWRGTAVQPRVAVHLGDPLSVVIVEGRAHQAAGAELFRRYVAAYNEKYSWTFEAGQQIVVERTIEVVPTAVLAWTTVPVSECTPDMTFPDAAGRWTF